MIFVLLGSIAASLMIVTFGVSVLGRNAVMFIRTSRKFQQRISPLVIRVSQMADVARNRAFKIMDKSQLLQRKVFLFTFTLARMRILISAWRRALEPVNRVRDYVGL